MTKKQFENELKRLEANGWEFVVIQPFAKYAVYQKNVKTITVGKKSKDL